MSWTRCATLVFLFGLPWPASAADDAERLVGTWTWSWKDAKGQEHRHVLEVEGAGDKVAARERFDDQEPVKIVDLKAVGTKVNFSVLRGPRTAFYSGTLADADTINGEVQVNTENRNDKFAWTAKREATRK